MYSIFLKPSDEAYLLKCAKEYKFAYGIIIGQQMKNGKYIVVHLARNVEEDGEVSDVSDSGHTKELNRTITGININALVTQCISASKMISGSFIVLGIFVCCEDEIVGEKSVKIAINKFFGMHCLISQNDNLLGNIDDTHQACSIFLLYFGNENKKKCILYSKKKSAGGSCLIEEPQFEWILIESSYELDETFPIANTPEKINLEEHLHETLMSVKQNMAISEIFIQSENVEESMSLEAYMKQKYGKRQNFQGVLRASIFLPGNKLSKANFVGVKEYNGTIRFSGAISSRIWCRSENTIKEIKHFIRVDILRSLAARIQIYCDGLTEPNANIDIITINEPPRRVYFASRKEEIQFSEYIFRGETPTVAVAQAKQVLDLDIDFSCIYDDLEGLPDDDAFTTVSSENQIQFTAATSLQRQITRSMYMLGTIVALFVLIVSILLHFTMG